MSDFIKQKLLSMPKGKLNQLIQRLPDEVLEALKYDWRNIWARDSQLAPDVNFRTWLIAAGRGAGKTRTAAEWIRERVETGQAKRIAIIGPTYSDVRETMMYGDSGLVEISPPGNKPVRKSGERLFEWPNGTTAQIFSSETPETLHGCMFDTAWCEEITYWRYEHMWDYLQLCMRLGNNPQIVVTADPSNPTALLKHIKEDKGTAFTYIKSGTEFWSVYLGKYLNDTTI